MSLYKRGDVWHYDFTVKGRRYRGSTNLRSKTAARKVEDAERERAALGAHNRVELTIEQAAAKWYVARAADKKSAKTTAHRLEIMLRHIGPQTLVGSIDSPEIEEALQARRLEAVGSLRPARRRTDNKPPSNATVNRDLIDSTLRPILRYAKRVLKQPVHDIDWSELRLDEPKGRSRSFVPEEMAAWSDGLPAWHRPLRDFIGRYGVRLREAFFPLSAINTDTWEITVRGPRRKNGLPHVIPLLEEDARMVAARISRARAAGLDTIWFREMKNGKLRPITARGFQTASKVGLRRANIDDARPAHDLRHHAGTTVMRAVGNLKVVQELLGHENIASTARYAHANRSDVLKALRHASATSETLTENDDIENNDLEAAGGGT